MPVLPAVKDDPNHDLHPSKVLERPKVVYNKKTGKFVMWVHVESADYSKACPGVSMILHFTPFQIIDVVAARTVIPLRFSISIESVMVSPLSTGRNRSGID